MALAGVSVLVSNSSKATVTDVNGKFSLSDIPANAKLTFSLVGYKPYEAGLPAGNTFDINLEEDSRELSEVVVTALGIRRTDRQLGYSIAKVDPDALVAKIRARCFEKVCREK